MVILVGRGGGFVEGALRERLAFEGSVIVLVPVV
jgi:hypothetical protein